MSDFTTSQLLPDGNPKRKTGAFASGIRNNTLVVVVTKAHGLRNVLKMDKQSPFITIRIQDQEESTKVVSRGGQTPTFNDELWFNLDGIEERTLYINVYHQKKNDAKLICCGEVDYTTALQRSTTEGFDGWFDLYWEGREAGKVYLEMTYYPRKGEVPIGTESAGRMQMSKKEKAFVNTEASSFGNSLREKTRKFRKSEVDNLPDLGELKIDESSSSIGKLNNKFSNFEKRYNSSRSPSHSPVQSPNHSPSKHELQKSENITFKENIHDSHNTPSNSNAVGNWFSFLDNTLKFPSILNNITFNTNNSNHGDTDKRNINDELNARVKLKVESPDLIQERPKKLFESDDENDDEYEIVPSRSEDLAQMRDVSVTDQWKKSIASRQEAIYKENGLIVSSLPLKRDDLRTDDEDSDSSDSDGEYTLGQVVDFRSSARSRKSKNSTKTTPQKTKLPRLDDDEMRRSYQGRRLPELKKDTFSGLSQSNEDDEDDEDDDDDTPPPPPPKHIISMSSLFDNSVSTAASGEKFVLHNSTSELPETAAQITSMDRNVETDKDSKRPLSWYERRKLERRRQR